MRIQNVSGASRLSNFWNFFGAIQMISCHNWLPWTKPGYITMTQRQSNNQRSGGIAAHPAPKNSECKNPLGKFSPKFFGIKTASSLLIIFQRAKLLLDLSGLAVVQTFQHFKVAKNVFDSFLYSEVD